MKTIACGIALSMTLIVGCMPGTYVTKNPGPANKGVRYYRPKPYLLITPVNTGTVATVTGPDGKPQSIVKADGVSDRLVQMQLQYLPDFSEEYAIRVRPGLGIANVSFKLQDGWNLTEMNQELDSNVDDNIKAVADLIGSASKFVPTSGAGSDRAGAIATVVAATNVPLGYYESVIGQGPDGIKRLYGWRYVGFLPYQQCPLNAGGQETWCCNHTGPIYGLVFVDGVMVFRPLDQVETGPDLRRHPDPTSVERLPAVSGQDVEGFKEEVRQLLGDQLVDFGVKQDGTTEVRVAAQNDPMRRDRLERSILDLAMRLGVRVSVAWVTLDDGPGL